MQMHHITCNDSCRLKAKDNHTPQELASVVGNLPKDLACLLLLLLLLLQAKCNGSCRMKAKDDHTPEELAIVVKNLPKDLATSCNIGLADFYPATSGKENAAKHIVEKFSSNLDASFLMCDDDNDMGKDFASCLDASF